MDLPLSTIDVWTFQNEFSPVPFLRQLRKILRDGDVIAVGSYSPSKRLTDSLIALGATETDVDVIYHVCFRFNRDEHPNGRSFELVTSDAILDALVTEAQRSDGQDDKPLFFDHIVAYRRGIPVIHLLSFHDAFYGGELIVSGLYSEEIIRDFAAGLSSAFERQQNPVISIR